MKKIIALLIAIVMMAAIAVPAFAAEYDPDGDNKVIVSYNVSGGYTVTIIDSIVLGDKDTAVSAGNVAVSDVLLDAGQTLTVSVTSANGYAVKNGDNAIAYSMTYGEETVTEGTEATAILTVASGTTAGSVALSFTRTADAPAGVAGTFEDELTFNVVVA